MLQILVMYSIWNMEYAKHFFLHVVVDHNTLDRFLLLMLKRTLPEKKSQLTIRAGVGTNSITTKISANLPILSCMVYCLVFHV